MRLARFGEDRLALIEGGALRDVTEWAYANCSRRVGDPLIAFIEALARGRVPEGPVAAGGARFGPPIRQPGKIVAAAANYLEHTREMNPGAPAPGGIREKGFFLKAPSSIIGPGEAIRLPFADRRIDHEAELAVIIGAPRAASKRPRRWRTFSAIRACSTSPCAARKTGACANPSTRSRRSGLAS